MITDKGKKLSNYFKIMLCDTTCKYILVLQNIIGAIKEIAKYNKLNFIGTMNNNRKSYIL